MSGQWIVVLVFQDIMQIAYFDVGVMTAMAAGITAMSFVTSGNFSKHCHVCNESVCPKGTIRQYANGHRKIQWTTPSFNALIDAPVM
jgi:hypothetical protein